jgi:hypothetical protein
VFEMKPRTKTVVPSDPTLKRPWEPRHSARMLAATPFSQAEHQTVSHEPPVIA